MNHSFQIYAASGASQLASNIGQQLDLPVEIIDTSKFPNQELKIRLKQVKSHAILIGSFASPVNTRIIEYLLIADALKRQGSSTIIGIITYLAYSKQDRVFLPGEPLSAKVIATLIQSGPFAKLFTLDLHNPSISGYFDIPVLNLSAVELLAKSAAANLKSDSVVVSPDAGSVKNSNRFAEKLAIPMVFATKHRDLQTGLVTFQNLSHTVQDKNIFIYDDMIATGSTLVELSAFLKAKGAKTVNVYCTHHLYLNGVQDKIDTSDIDSLTVTNTITKPENLHSQKLKFIDVSPIITNQLATEVHYG